MNHLQCSHCPGANRAHYSHLQIIHLTRCPSDSPIMFLMGTNMFCAQNIIGGCSLGYHACTQAGAQQTVTSHCTLVTDTLKTFQTHNISMKTTPPITCLSPRFDSYPDGVTYALVLLFLSLQRYFKANLEHDVIVRPLICR